MLRSDLHAYKYMLQMEVDIVPVTKHWATSLLNMAEQNSARPGLPPFWVLGAGTEHKWWPTDAERMHLEEVIPMEPAQIQTKDWSEDSPLPPCDARQDALSAACHPGETPTPVYEFNGNALYNLVPEFLRFLEQFSEWFNSAKGLEGKGGFDTWMARYALSKQQGAQFLRDRIVDTSLIVNCDAQSVRQCMARTSFDEAFDGWQAAKLRTTVLMHGRFMNANENVSNDVINSRWRMMCQLVDGSRG